MNHSRAYIKYCQQKRKHNLRLSFLALALLLISLITMTYCWIEGSTAINILNDNTNILIKDTSWCKFVVADEEYVANSITLSDYIDNKDNLYLAPAQMLNGVLQIKDSDATYRNVNTNDIGNNYIEFDVKIKVNEEHKFSFTPESKITVGGKTVNPIKVALKLDNTIVGQFDSDLTQIGGNSREAFIISDTKTHNLKVMIWYDDAVAKSTSFNGKGELVNFDFELIAENNLTSLTFVDMTTSKTAQHLANSYTVKAAVTINGSVKEYTLTKGNNNSYTSGEVIPMSGLSTAEFRCYNGSTLMGKWVANGATPDATYTAYGGLSTSNGLGTWNNVVPVNFSDKSIDTLFITGSNHVTIFNGIDTYCYNMYYNSSTKIWTAYVPVETFTENKEIYFNARSNADNSDTINYCIAPDDFATTPANPTFSVYGSTTTISSDGDVEYIGKWCSGFDTITVRAYDTTIRNVKDNFWVSFDGKQNYYKAKYNSSTGYWSFNVPNDDISTLDFKAGTYLFDGKNREKTAEEYIYSITSTTVGSWTYVNKQNVTVNDAPYAVVTASYKTSTGATVTINEGQTVEVTEGTVLTLTAQMSTGISKNNANGHKFTKFTVNTTNYTTNNASVQVKNEDLVISTTTTPYDFYIGGEGFEGWTSGWDSNYKQMTYNASTNTVSATLVNSVAADAMFKITMGAFSNRDNTSYSVTLNAPTVTKSGDITSASLKTSGSTTDTCVYFDAPVGSEITVTYKLDTHTITVNGVAPAVTYYTIYLNNSQKWGTPKAYYWEDLGEEPVAWPGDNMTKVTGNIWKVEINSKYNRVIFNNGGNSQTDDLTIPGDNYIYDYSTGQWSVYDPNVSTKCTYYFAVKSAWNSYTVQYNNKWKSGTVTNNWKYDNMTDTGKTYNGNKVWKVTFPREDVFYNIAFKMMSDSTQKDYLQVYAGDGKPITDIDNKMYVVDSETWITYNLG